MPEGFDGFGGFYDATDGGADGAARRPNGAGFKRERPAGSLEIVSFAEMEPRLDDRTIIGGLINDGELSLVIGSSGAGKSFLVIDMVLHIAAGWPWFGRRTQQMGVLYIASEAGKGIINRVAAYKQSFPDFSLDLPFSAVVSPVDLYDPQAAMDQIVDVIRQLGVRLVVIDTLSRAMGGGDENSPEGMGGFVLNIDRIRSLTGVHVLVVHHLGKDTTKGARGHSLLKAAVDTEIEVTRDEDLTISTAKVTKQRELALSGTFAFCLKQVELGRNQFRESVTSCIVEPVEITPTKGVKMSNSEKLALRLLGEAINTAGERPPSCNHVPSNVRAVREDLWRQYCYQGGISSSEKADSRLKAFTRAAEGLIANGRVGKWEPWVWIA